MSGAYSAAYATAYDIALTEPVTPCGPSYATVADYELRTGMKVPAGQYDTVARRLDDASAYVALYLGACADEAAAKFPALLSSVVCNHVARVGSVPSGIRSESIAGTSVSYVDASSPGDFLGAETAILDTILAQTSCGANSYRGVGELGVNWGGSPGPYWYADEVPA